MFYLWLAVLFYFCVLNTRIAAAAADLAELPDNNEKFTQTTSNTLAIGLNRQAQIYSYEILKVPDRQIKHAYQMHSEPETI